MRGGSLLSFLMLALSWHLIHAKLPPITEAKAPYYTKQFGMDYVNPQEIRVDGDILINWGTHVDDLRYFMEIPFHAPFFPDWVTKDAKILDDFTQLIPENIQSGQNCKTLLSPGTILYREYDCTFGTQDRTYTTSKHRDIPINPADSSQYPLARIRSCCDPATCPEKNFEIPFKQNIRFIVYNIKWSQNLYFAGKCDLCVIQDGVRACSNGEYASSYSEYDQVSHMLKL